MLTAIQVNKSYRKKDILKGIDLKFKTGVHALIGPNGAGKSTLLRILAGCEQLSHGEVMCDSLSLQVHPEDYRAKIGYLPQQFKIEGNITIEKFMDYAAVLKGLKKRKVRQEEIERCLEAVGLTDRLNSKIKELSTGMVQRVGVAQALLDTPDILIVDEPTIGLDPSERIRFRELMNEYGKNRIVLLSTHIASDITRNYSSVSVIKSGKIVFNGSTDELAQLATNKVWAFTSPTPLPINKEQLLIRKTAQELTYKILTSTPPSHAFPLEPTLMDGYLAIVRSSEYV